MLYRFTIKAAWNDGTLVENVLHYRTVPPAGSDEPAAIDVATAIWGHIGDQWLENQSNHLTVVEVDLVEEVIDGSLPAGATLAVGVHGSVSSTEDDLPKAMCMILNKHTDRHGRSARGWLAYPIAPQSRFVLADRWTSAIITDAGDIANVLAEQFSIGEFIDTLVAPIVYSRVRRVRGEAEYFFTITSVSINPMVHWLRSRTTSP